MDYFLIAEKLVILRFDFFYTWDIWLSSFLQASVEHSLQMPAKMMKCLSISDNIKMSCQLGREGQTKYSNSTALALVQCFKWRFTIRGYIPFGINLTRKFRCRPSLNSNSNQNIDWPWFLMRLLNWRDANAPHPRKRISAPSLCLIS